MNKKQILGVVRHILTFGGGYLAGKGILDAAEIDAAIAAVVTLIGIVWSAVSPEKKSDDQ